MNGNENVVSPPWGSLPVERYLLVSKLGAHVREKVHRNNTNIKCRANGTQAHPSRWQNNAKRS